MVTHLHFKFSISIVLERIYGFFQLIAHIIINICFLFRSISANISEYDSQFQEEFSYKVIH